MPMNINGNWNTGGGLGMNTGIGAKKLFNAGAEVFDILNQQTNISRQVDAFSRRDSRNNAIYQYAMFSAILRFSVYGGKNTMGTDKEKK